MEQRRKFNHPIHAFRGFAILNIVAIHAFGFIFFHAASGENAPKTALAAFEWANGILLHDSTLYFTFISGILFSMVLADRGYRRFFRSKISYVLLPYVLFTCLYTLTSIPPEGAATPSDGGMVTFALLVGNNLLTGGAVFAFWYIPVLLVLYVATPFLAKLLAVKSATWPIVLIILLPLVFSRVWPEIRWTNFVYFLGAYMLGMYVGANYRVTMGWIRKNVTSLSLIAIGSTIILVALFWRESPTWGIVIFAESFWYIQKVAFSALVLLLFERTMTRVPKWLDVLGNYAFAIYFLHSGVLFMTYGLISKWGVVLDSAPLILVFAVGNFVFVIIASVMITYALKMALRGSSRYVVGA